MQADPGQTGYGAPKYIDMKPYHKSNWRRFINDEAQALGTDLISAWCAIAKCDGISIVDAAASLSAETGRHYSPNLVYRWRRGDAQVPEPAARMMRRDVLRRVIGYSSDAVLLILEPPSRRMTTHV